MNRKTKALTLALCALLLVAATVFTTLAYLTDSAEVENTFTVGKVDISLDEAKTNQCGEPDPDADRVHTNTYKLIPGQTYTKDPTIHVSADSEPCYLFADVQNGLAGILVDPTIEAQIIENGWTLVEGETTVYWREGAPGRDYVLFNGFTVDPAADNEDLAPYASATITVKGYAIQRAQLNSAEEAWEALENQMP